MLRENYVDNYEVLQEQRKKEIEALNESHDDIVEDLQRQISNNLAEYEANTEKLMDQNDTSSKSLTEQMNTLRLEHIKSMEKQAQINFEDTQALKVAHHNQIKDLKDK